MVEKFLNAIASIRFCMRFMPFKQAIKRPIQIPYNMRVDIHPNARIEIEGELFPYMIKLGFIGAPYINHNLSILHLGENSILRFVGGGIFGNGVCIWLDDNAEMIVGKDFYCNANCTFRCSENQKITIADKVLLGWNIMLNTTDGHVIEVDGVTHRNSGDITIGYHTWVASDTIICKGVCIAEECIIAQRSLVNKNFSIPHKLIGGIPAKEIRGDVKRND